jgi:hypothetical protein
MSETFRFDRRGALLGVSVMSAAALANVPVRADAKAAPVDLADPRFNMMTLSKLQSDLSGKVNYGYSRGQVYGIRVGKGLQIAEYGVRIYDYEGASVKRSRVRADGSVETRSRSWLFYRDPETGAYLKSFKNPYTGQTVDVPPFRGGISGGVLTLNGPEVSANFTMESTVFNKPTKLEYMVVGKRAWITRHAFTRWVPKGGAARTEFTLDVWECLAKDLYNMRSTAIEATSSWTSQTEFQTWLKMPEDVQGHQIWRSDGMRVYSIDDLPPDFVKQSKAEMPGLLTDPIEFKA